MASLEERFRRVGYAMREARAKRAAQEVLFRGYGMRQDSNRRLSQVDEAKVCKALEELTSW